MSATRLQISEAAEGIKAEQIRAARAEALRTRRRVVEVLEEQLGFPQEKFLAALAATFFYPVVSMHDVNALQPVFDLVSYGESVKHGCIALRDPAGKTILAFDDPFAVELQDRMDERIKTEFTWALIHHADLRAYLARHEENFQALDSVRGEREQDTMLQQGIEDLSLKTISEDTSDVVRLVRSTLRDALKIGASDIHFETTASSLVIKFRIDGTLTEVKTIADLQQAEQAISRIKVLAELDITERRIPQDGRFKALDKGREVDFRISIMPSIFGEDAVLRILDKQALLNELQTLNLDNLGFEPAVVKQLRHLASEPYGMLLVTGPTGSGKTTTLYAAISEINHGYDKIITIEDPVEYQLPGVLQIPVNEKKGLTFAVGLRSILRHDPDKIMVGEIRDAETANIAVQSALTGHLVFTTIHANNVFDVIGRLMHMQIDLYSIVSALNGIVAQRLVRVICPHCAEDYVPDAGMLSDSGLQPENVSEYKFKFARGCGHCRGSGYRGRKAIAELLLLNDEIRELIATRAPIRKIKDAARANGTRFLRESALNLVQSGETTLQEVNRVTFVA